MHIVNDFFLLVWQEDARTILSMTSDIDKHLSESFSKDEEIFCDYTTITLACDFQNIEKFSLLQSTQNALLYLSGAMDVDKQRVQFLQKELLLFLNKEGNIELNKKIEKRIDRLRSESIIGY